MQLTTFLHPIVPIRIFIAIAPIRIFGADNDEIAIICIMRIKGTVVAHTCIPFGDGNSHECFYRFEKIGSGQKSPTTVCVASDLCSLRA